MVLATGIDSGLVEDARRSSQFYKYSAEPSVSFYL